MSNVAGRPETSPTSTAGGSDTRDDGPRDDSVLPIESLEEVFARILSPPPDALPAASASAEIGGLPTCDHSTAALAGREPPTALAGEPSTALIIGETLWRLTLAASSFLASLPSRAARAVVPTETSTLASLLYELFGKIMGDLDVSYVSFALALQLIEACTLRFLPFPRLLSSVPLPAADHGVVQHARHRMRHASASYGWRMLYGLGVCGGPADVARCLTADSREADLEAIMRHTGLPRQAIVHYQMRTGTASTACIPPLGAESAAWRSALPAGHFEPSFVVLYDAATERLVVSFRGTMSLADTLVDLACEPVPFLTGEAHEGMLRTARLFIHAHLAMLVDALAAAPPGTRLELCGHSLGAGVAILVTLMLHAEHADAVGPVHCFAFGPPCVLSPSLACAPDTLRLVDSFVHGDDMVCALSLASLVNLRTVVARLAADPRHSALNRVVQLMALGNALGDSLTDRLTRLTATELEFSVEDLVLPHTHAARAPPRLLPAGTVYFLARPTRSAAGHYRLMLAHPMAFSELRVAPGMARDHLPSAYESALENALVRFPCEAALAPVVLARDESGRTDVGMR